VLQYVVAGLVLGGIYAIAAAGIVTTYISAGILNLSFGALAFAIARFYYFLHTQHHINLLVSAIVAIVVAGPALGVALYLLVFRLLGMRSQLVKLVATIGVAVAVPSACALTFGTQPINQAPGLAPEPVRVFHVFGVAVTMDQVIAYACVLVILVVGAGVLGFTSVGLRVRSMVDSPAMTALSGVNPSSVALGVWAVSIGLAGLAGVLSAPIIGLDSGDFTLLMISALAAVVAGRLRNLGVTVCIAFLIGISDSIVQYWISPTSSFAAAILPSIPFIFAALFLGYFVLRGDGREGAGRVGGSLDRAIATHDDGSHTSSGPAARRIGVVPAIVAFGMTCLLPALMSDFWVGLVAQGVCYGIIYLSYTLVTGEGGMIWLCMSAFAGVGGLSAAVLAADHGVPALLAVVCGGLIAVPAGLLIGLLTIRMGDLYVAIVTLIFALLIENLVFSRQVFENSGLGVAINPPHVFAGPRGEAWLSLAVFAVIAGCIGVLRRSTTGLGLTAVRSAPRASATVGISVVRLKVGVACAAAFTAGIGGAMLAMNLNVAQSANYDALLGLAWLAAVATLGIRSNMGAILAGLATTLLSGVILQYLSAGWDNVPPILFGLGAIAVVRYPDGTLATQARQVAAIWTTIRRRLAAARGGSTAGGVDAPAPDAQQGRHESDLDIGGGRAPGSSPSALVSVVVKQPGQHDEPPLLRCRDVTVRFGGVRALNGVTVSIPPGAIVGLVGPNGAGKSTLFGVLSGLIKPDAGEVFLNEEEITGVRPQVRSRLGIARTFQQPELFLGLTVREHLILSHRMRHKVGPNWRGAGAGGAGRGVRIAERERVDELIDELSLASVAEQRVDSLPLGTTRLIEVARALAFEPSIVLLDEPLAGLDTQESERLGSVLQATSAERGVAMLLVEHDVGAVMRLAQHIYVLDFGSKVAEGPPERIRSSEVVREAYLGSTGSWAVQVAEEDGLGHR